MKNNQIISLSRGNRKLGSVMNISTTPGRCCPKGVPCASDGCYANKAIRMYPGTRAAWRRNELIARREPESYFSQIAAQVTKAKPRLFRFHVAGDILNRDGSGANSKGEWVTVMIWKKWADDERVKRHEGSVCRAPFRPGCDHPLCALVPMLQAQLS